jgi:proteasome lid subunit RPN8/RPN11
MLPGLGIQRHGKPIGVVYNDAPVVLVHGEVLDELVEYSSRDLRREQGAFLLGVHHTSPHEAVEIRHFLPATDTRNAAGSITFTHDTWSALHRQAGEKFPDDIVLGWHHTHPNFGIFLSPFDQFIQRNFFRESWQIALVVDPWKCEFGFFQWRQEKIVDCGFICLEP